MGTSMIYFCRLVLMAYFESPFITGTMLTTKKMAILKKEENGDSQKGGREMIVLWAWAWLPPTNGGSDPTPTVVSSPAQRAPPCLQFVLVLHLHLDLHHHLHLHLHLPASSLSLSSTFLHNTSASNVTMPPKS